MLKNITSKIRMLFKFLAELKQEKSFTPAYRLVEIQQTEIDEYIVTIQIINKNVTFKTKPEEILSNDSLVDQFSPRDIRALTYLGYLSINSPKYKILAQRLSEKSDKVLFALRKKGDKKIIIKSANEILNEKDIIDSFNSTDARIIGYTVASENIINEKKMKENLKALNKQ